MSGREPTYTTAYIELIYTFYRLFGWGMRQTTGYMEDFWATRGLDIPVPSSGQLCDRFAVLEVRATQRCAQLPRWLARGEAIAMTCAIHRHRFTFLNVVFLARLSSWLR
ncbi:transposase [Paraburkholderia aspalathi]|uniref:transposase n=1 Tax=Paraburkholderia aspalathi TaxID=1324617 RepID=UPI00355784B1